MVGGPDFSTRFPIIYRGIRQYIELEDLPGARDEALQIARLLQVEPRIGSEASFAAVLDHYYEPGDETTESKRRGRPFAPILHLATHGLTDTWEPEQSFIAFTDRLLTADYLYTFDPGLPTRLVMMSCCQTAVGYTHPDSIVGLANAFLVAGACTVGSTLWNVDDDATSTLMAHFYGEIKRGMDVSAAMSAAQNHLRSFLIWSHPFYWAPFRVTGSFSNPLNLTAKVE